MAAKRNGTLVLIKVATKLLVGQNSLSYSKACTMIDVSSKTSGNHSEFEAGRITDNLSVSGIASTDKESTKAGYWELYDAIEAQAPVTVTFVQYSDEAGTTAVTGSEQISVSCFVSNLNREDPDNAASTFSCDLQVTGDPTRTTVAP